MTLIQHLQVPTFEYNMLRKMFGCAESKIITETVSDNEQFKMSQGHSLLSIDPGLGLPHKDTLFSWFQLTHTHTHKITANQQLKICITLPAKCAVLTVWVMLQLCLLWLPTEQPANAANTRSDSSQTATVSARKTPPESFTWIT
jgi:hypothetical protein